MSITKARVRSFVWNYHEIDMTNRMSLFAWSHLADKGAPLKDDKTVAKVSLATDVIDTEAKNSLVTDNVVSKISLTKSGTVRGLEVVNLGCTHTRVIVICLLRDVTTPTTVTIYKGAL